MRNTMLITVLGINPDTGKCELDVLVNDPEVMESLCAHPAYSHLSMFAYTGTGREVVGLHGAA